MRHGPRGSVMRVVLIAAMAAALWVCVSVKAQEDAAEPPVIVHSLTINASGLAAGESQRLVQKFQGGKYSPEELAERVRQALRDEGYHEAKCALDGVKDSDDGQTADITLRVNAGAQYRLAGIRFSGTSLFPAQQLRALFVVEDGTLFNATAIGWGLEAMKNLYAENGYLNFGAIPNVQVDEDHRTIALTIDVDQGKRLYFGRLFLEGVEPKVGAAQSLQAAWANLREKPYSPKSLSDWMAANAPYWPADSQELDHVSLHQNPETLQLDVVLEFP